MRKITEIIIHCSATKEGMDFTVEDIDRWHRKRGFNGIGYHFVIYRDGSIHAGRSKNLIGAHCKGHNAHSIGICYVGGLSTDGKPKDTRTAAQKASLRALVEHAGRVPSRHRSRPQRVRRQSLSLLRCSERIRLIR